VSLSRTNLCRPMKAGGLLFFRKWRNGPRLGRVTLPVQKKDKPVVQVC